MALAEWLNEIDFDRIDPQYLKEDPDEGWLAVFNPNVEREFDVELLHTFSHERFSEEGNFFATGCNRTAQIYDVRTGEKICVLHHEFETENTSGRDSDYLYIRSLCFSLDGRYLCTGSDDNLIRIWNIARKEIHNIFRGHQQDVYSLASSRDGRFLVSGSGDSTTRIWDMETGSYREFAIENPDINNGVTSVAISPDGGILVAASLDSNIRVWNIETGSLLMTLRGHMDSVYSVCFTPDGNGLVSASLDKKLKYWDIEPLAETRNRQQVRSDGNNDVNGVIEVPRRIICRFDLDGHKDYVLSGAASPNSKWIASGSKDRCVQFWEKETGKAQFLLRGHTNSVISVNFGSRDGLLATGSGDFKARLWRYTTL